MRRTLARWSTAPYEVFNRSHKVIQRGRAAQNVTSSRTVDYLRDEIARRAVERLAFITRDFSRVVDLGAGSGYIEKALCNAEDEDARLVKKRMSGEIEMVDSCRELLYRDNDLPFNSELNLRRVIADEETFSAPSNSVDAVLSSMSMHWINDLPGTLKRIEQMLKPDGLFLATMLGGESLFELRTSMQLAEQERRGGMSPRLSPLVNPSDMGNLMQRAGFKLITLDLDQVIINYPDMFALLEDIKLMGESNAVASRPVTIGRDLLQAASAIYQEMHGEEDGSIPATFKIVNMVGWKHADTQQKPLKRGSAPRGFSIKGSDTNN